MRVVDLIIKKREGLPLQPGEIDFLVQGYTKGEIPDYQIASFLMATYLQGMEDAETLALTESMVRSGMTLDLSSLPGPSADKHSTGGVGDKVSLALVPLGAACGLYLAKMSGRGLGHTGGTIDKLESIPGFHTEIGTEQLLEQVRRIGCAIVGQTIDLTPADGKIYALRDVTGTVESFPLIASSVMSKKIASGAQNIVIDVKCGLGAFMKNEKDAFRLARLMVLIGERMGRRVACIISPMDEPLGYAVGNALEVLEAVETLQGHGPADFARSVLHLTAELLHLACLARSLEEGYTMAERALAEGRGMEKFCRMVEAQGGDLRILEGIRLQLPVLFEEQISAPRKGFIQSVDAMWIGQAVMLLGAGRERKGDRVDPAAGLRLAVKVGQAVSRGDLLATLYTNRGDKLEEARTLVRSAFAISSKPVAPSPLLLGRVGHD